MYESSVAASNAASQARCMAPFPLRIDEGGGEAEKSTGESLEGAAADC